MQIKRCAHPQFTFDINASSMGIHHIFNNFGPQPRPFLFGGDSLGVKKAIRTPGHMPRPLSPTVTRIPPPIILLSGNRDQASPGNLRNGIADEIVKSGKERCSSASMTGSASRPSVSTGPPAPPHRVSGLRTRPSPQWISGRGQNGGDSSPFDRIGNFPHAPLYRLHSNHPGEYLTIGITRLSPFDLHFHPIRKLLLQFILQ